MKIRLKEWNQAMQVLNEQEVAQNVQKIAQDVREAALQAGSPLFVIDGAVLVGSVIDGIWDRLIVVTAPYEVSVERIVARDGIRPEMARRRLDAQLPEAALTARADIVLANDGTQEQLRRQAGALAARLLAEGERGTDCPV